MSCCRQRGVLNLAHTLGDVREGVRRVNANRLNGIDAEWLEPDAVKRVLPDPQHRPDGALSGARRDLAAARRGGAARRGRLGLCPRRRCARRRHHRELRGDRDPHRRRPGRRGRDDARHDRRRQGRDLRRRALFGAGGDGRGAPAAAEPPAAGAGVGAGQAGARLRRDVEHGACLCQPVGQGRAGDGRRHRRVQLLRPARLVPDHRGADGGARSSCSRSSRG